MAIDQITSSQTGKEQSISELFDSLLSFFTLRRRVRGSTGLTLEFFGGQFKGLTLANQSITLATSSTIYVEANATTGVVTSNALAYTSGRIPLGIAVTNTTGVVSWTPKDNMTWPTTP